MEHIEASSERERSAVDFGLLHEDSPEIPPRAHYCGSKGPELSHRRRLYYNVSHALRCDSLSNRVRRECWTVSYGRGEMLRSALFTFVT
jgi:hypothetical protein